jgi:hypothetical protein
MSVPSGDSQDLVKEASLINNRFEQLINKLSGGAHIKYIDNRL